MHSNAEAPVRQAPTAPAGEYDQSPGKLLAEMAENSRKQLLLTRISAVALAAIFSVVLICAALVVPKTVRVLNDVSAVSDRLDDIELEEMLDDVNRLLETLGPVADELEPLMDNVNDTVLEAQRDMEAALKAIEAIDIETLNEAISDLAAVVEPLARLFKR